MHPFWASLAGGVIGGGALLWAAGAGELHGRQSWWHCHGIVCLPRLAHLRLWSWQHWQL